MRKIFKIKDLVVLCALGGGLVTGNASAATCGIQASAETSLQGILDGITTTGPSSVTASTDCLVDGTDSNWSITGSGLSGTTMIIELAGQAGTNTFGVYDTSNSNNFVELFNGGASAGSQVVMSIKLDGSVHINLADTLTDFAGNNFGYYLDIGNDRFFSDTALNGDAADHMLAYQGTGDNIQIATNAAGDWTPNEYVLAWEDVTGGAADFDYNDMVMIVESVQPVPVPAAVWLFGSGLIGLVGVARRRA